MHTPKHRFSRYFVHNTATEAVNESGIGNGLTHYANQKLAKCPIYYRNSPRRCALSEASKIFPQLLDGFALDTLGASYEVRIKEGGGGDSQSACVAVLIDPEPKFLQPIDPALFVQIKVEFLGSEWSDLSKYKREPEEYHDVTYHMHQAQHSHFDRELPIKVSPCSIGGLFGVNIKPKDPDSKLPRPDALILPDLISQLRDTAGCSMFLLPEREYEDVDVLRTTLPVRVWGRRLAQVELEIGMARNHYEVSVGN